MAQIRIAHTLNEGEKRYLSGRKISVQQCLEKNNIPCSLSKVPNIAILGSGGGERAMVGLLGTLYQMGEEGLLDAALYMSGVSGSTWCMASVYKESDWSSNIQQLKNIAEKIGHDSVSVMDRIKLLMKYHLQNANFSLTDIWAAVIVPEFVKQIDDESTLSKYKGGHDKDPYPIYTVINQDCKYQGLLRECFFEFTPDEAGYSLAGAFVETSTFGSIFNNGVVVRDGVKPEMDMTYLQGACGSALADKETILKVLKEWLEGPIKDHDGVQLLRTMVDLLLSHHKDHSDRTTLFQNANKLLKGRQGLDGHEMRFNVDVKNYHNQNQQIHTTTSSICQKFFEWFKDLEDRDVSEELHVFVKTLDKVNEKPPHRPGGAGASHAKHLEQRLQMVMDRVKREAAGMESHDGPKLLLKTLELNSRILREDGEDWTPLADELNVLLTGKKTVDGRDLKINKDMWVKADLKSRQELALGLTFDICKSFFSWFGDLKNEIWNAIIRDLLRVVRWFLEKFWIWGTNYNFLYNMTTPDIKPMLLKSKTSHFEDAGLLDNSPFMSVLRAERNIDLIISFDFSQGDSMETVYATAKQCKKLHIPFPPIPKKKHFPPKAFYVFRGNKTPTVIHIPLFNSVNCGTKVECYREKYRTFQMPYSPEMIKDLMTKAGENVKINKKNILSEIESIVKQK